MVEIKHKISLCISTYNWPAALRCCLQSVAKQSVLPTEVIIGDDGSTYETADLIEEMRSVFTIPIIHVWQKDEGFKLAQIRNKSFAKASGNYIIQIDGDIILHKDFVKDHLHFAKKGTFLCGTRMLLSPEVSQQILANPENEISRQGEKKYNAFRFLPLAYSIYWFQRGSRQVKYVLGANMSFFKEDLLKVNGYNETFKGWGKEDNELAQRLCNAGVALRFIKFAGVEYHLYHKEAAKNNIEQNEKLLAETAASGVTFIKEGMGAYTN